MRESWATIPKTQGVFPRSFEIRVVARNSRIPELGVALITSDTGFLISIVSGFYSAVVFANYRQDIQRLLQPIEKRLQNVIFPTLCPLPVSIMLLWSIYLSPDTLIIIFGVQLIHPQLIMIGVLIIYTDILVDMTCSNREILDFAHLASSDHILEFRGTSVVLNLRFRGLFIR